MKSEAQANHVALREVTAQTVRAVTDLKVAPQQEGYVASNAVSIAQAYFAPEAWFRAIYAAENLIGFAMLRDRTLLAQPHMKAEISLWRFMIAADYQGRGFGKRALALLIAHARTRPGVRFLETSYVLGPHGPKEFYLAFGFQHTGQVKDNGEVCLQFPLN